MYNLNIFRQFMFIRFKNYVTTKKMLENISKINYLCDVKEVWSNFVIIYVLMGFIIIIIIIIIIS